MMPKDVDVKSFGPYSAWTYRLVDLGKKLQHCGHGVLGDLEAGTRVEHAYQDKNAMVEVFPLT